MSEAWIKQVLEAQDTAVRVTIIRAAGSAPQGAGAGMTVTVDGFSGTVGGGALEKAALEIAIGLLNETTDEPWRRVARDIPLGPALGQCCGGAVTLLFEIVGEIERRTLADADESADGIVCVRPVERGMPAAFVHHRKDDSDAWPLTVRGAVRDMLSGTRPREALLIDGWFIEPLGRPRQPLFLYGAGHVGRAVVKAFADLPFHIHWVDTDATRYPETVPADVTRLVARDPVLAARHAPAGAWHVVMTFSHALDLDICRAVLAGGDFAYLGVIASKTKRRRFEKRLRDEGVPEASLRRLSAPIGLPGLDGKEPATIALSLAADLMIRLNEQGLEEARPKTGTINGEREG